jgi:hypothetical protein
VLKRREATMDVSHSGELQFKPTKDITMTYPTNTPFDIIRVGDLYFTCFQGAWFVSITTKGPGWTLGGYMIPSLFRHFEEVAKYPHKPSLIKGGPLPQIPPENRFY